MQVDSLTFILISELTVGLLIAVIVYLVWIIRRKTRDQVAVRDFIERLKQTETNRAEELNKRLQELSNVSEEQLSEALAEVGIQEKALYKQIIEVFLHRSLDSVVDVDSRVKAIIEPFCKLLADADANNKGVDASVLDDLEKARKLLEEQNARVKQMRFESNQLSEQLNTALETLDEVSSEYSKMFGESKNAEELEVSQKKMLNVFRQAEQKTKQISSNKFDSNAPENLGA